MTRPQLQKLLTTVSHGDVVIIPAVDHLSRDTTDLLVIDDPSGISARAQSVRRRTRRISP